MNLIGEAQFENMFGVWRCWARNSTEIWAWITTEDQEQPTESLSVYQQDHTSTTKTHDTQTRTTSRVAKTELSPAWLLALLKSWSELPSTRF